ncbi:BTAD domain-containing putative transcriptional regulator [Derxia gummosa]|uniref:BTAD domain-containing putative transcriptional regulator n=1 Tax=Derxia gummosa DSM 723 TaxID=1121388 RepID=A0A8B6X0P2_9BURK|nr:BTAD domain-containing putative transcriptional regulator [Derxia gummosa]
MASIPAKFDLPDSRRAMPRERLLSALDYAFETARCVWVCAEPGSGKTTLAANWPATRQRPAAWYRIDPADADTAVFAEDFAAMLGWHGADEPPRGKGKRAAPPVPPLPLWEPTQAAEPEVFLRRYFRAAFARLPEGGVLVFDNAQEMAPERFDRLFALALDEAPADRRFIVTSHARPGPALARAQSKGLVEVLGEAALRFTVGETGELIAARTRGQADEARAAEVHGATRGWAAGIVMLGASGMSALAGLGDAASADAERRDREALVERWFATEVDERLDPASRELLSAVALMGEFSAASAVSLSGRADAPALLDALAERHLFVQRHGGPRPVYELHGLFRRHLRDRLGADGARARYLPTLAALVAEHRGDEAIDLALDFADTDAAVELLEMGAEGFARGGRVERLQAWLARLPREPLAARGWLAYWIGMATVQVDEIEARGWFELAFERFRADADAAGLTSAICAALFAYNADWGSFEALDTWRARAAEHLPALDTISDPAIRLRAGVARLCAGLLADPIDLDSAEVRAAAEALHALLGDQASGTDATERCIASQMLVEYADLESRMEWVTPIIGITVASFGAERVSELRRGRWYLSLANAHFHHNQPKQEAEALATVRAIVAESKLRLLQTGLLVCEAQQLLAGSDHAATGAKLDELGRHVDPKRPLLLGFFYYNFRSRLHLITGRFAQARENIELALDAARRANLSLGRQLPIQLTLAYAHIGEGDCEAAAEVFGQLCASITGKQGLGIRAMQECCHALVAMRDGADPAASLRTAFTLLRDIGTPMVMRPLPAVVARLCSAALRLRIEPEFAREMVRLRALAAPADADEHWPWAVRVRCFGGFEVFVDGAPLKLGAKAPKKPLELLKFLASRAGRQADVTTVLSACWPESDGDAARSAFDMAVSRLRKLLGKPEAIIVGEGRISLDPQLVWPDSCGLDLVAESLRADVIAHDSVAERLLAVYRGNFLGDETEAPWMVEARERYRATFVKSAERLCELLRGAGRLDAAIALGERAVEVEPLAEAVYGQIIRALLAQDREADARRVFRRCEQMLSVMLGIKPSAATVALLNPR